MLVSKECWERGCSCYDDRVDKDPVLIAAAIARKEKEVVKRQWVGLTDEEIKEIIGPWGDTPIKGYTRKLFDQIEAKLRSKNDQA